jgi:phosphate/phosphite/phosphonate ABC transporter binding protein
MSRASRIWSVVIFAALFLVPAVHQADAAEEYKIGVLAKNGAGKAIAQWGRHGEYLSSALGVSFSILPVTFSAIDFAVKEKKIDFLISNPAIFAEMKDKYEAQAIATMINEVNGKHVHQFGGVLIARKDSPIEKLEDIKGKRFGFVKKNSFGGLHAALYLLKTNGIIPEKDCSLYSERGTHESVVTSVANGFLDVGTVRTDTLERMAEDKKISLSDFKVIHKVEDDFPFAHSTILYPEWPMAALAHVDKQLSGKVAAALVEMKRDVTAAQEAKIGGWEKAVDYSPVLECLRTIGVAAGE